MLVYFDKIFSCDYFSYNCTFCCIIDTFLCFCWEYVPISNPVNDITAAAPIICWEYVPIYDITATAPIISICYSLTRHHRHCCTAEIIALM